MKTIYLKRKITYEKRSSLKMGDLITKVTYIKSYIFGLPIKTLQKYRETYYRDNTDYKDCFLFI